MRTRMRGTHPKRKASFPLTIPKPASVARDLGKAHTFANESTIVHLSLVVVLYYLTHAARLDLSPLRGHTGKKDAVVDDFLHR